MQILTDTESTDLNKMFKSGKINMIGGDTRNIYVFQHTYGNRNDFVLYINVEPGTIGRYINGFKSYCADTTTNFNDYMNKRNSFNFIKYLTAQGIDCVEIDIEGIIDF